MGGARLFLLGGQGAGHVGAGISHGRITERGAAAGRRGQGTEGRSCPPPARTDRVGGTAAVGYNSANYYPYNLYHQVILLNSIKICC